MTQRLWGLTTKYLIPESLRDTCSISKNPTIPCKKCLISDKTLSEQPDPAESVPWKSRGWISWKEEKSLIPKCLFFPDFLSCRSQTAQLLVSNSLMNGMAAPGCQQEHPGLAGTAGFGHFGSFLLSRQLEASIALPGTKPKGLFLLHGVRMDLFLLKVIFCLCWFYWFCTAPRWDTLMSTLIFGAIFMAVIGWDLFSFPFWFASY